MEKEDYYKTEFLKVLTNLIEMQYPEVIVDENKFSLPDKKMSFQVLDSAFYFQLDPLVFRKVKQFAKNTSWYIWFLKFSIKLTSSTGKTYSYPKLRDYLGKNENDAIMGATYFFACVNYTIQFFSLALDHQKAAHLNSFATEETITYTGAGNGNKIKETSYKKESNSD